MSLVALEDLMAERVPSVDPSKYPDEEFELLSIPAFDAGDAEHVLGSDIGSAKKAVMPNDVLLARIVPHIRRAWVVPDLTDRRQIASGEWIVFRSERFYPPYLRHVLISDPFHAEFMQTVAGVGGSLLRARPEGVKKIKIPLPPLEEQKRIAGVLDQADALRRLRARALEKLNTLGQAVFQEMFGNSIKNYPIEKLGTVCDVRDGTHDSPKYVEDGHPLLTSKNFSNGVIDYNGAKYISTEDYDKINKRSKVHIGDIVMPMIGTIGSPVLVNIEPDFAIKNVALIKRKNGSPLPIYVQSFLSSETVKRIFLETGKGGTQKFVSLGDIRALEIPIPDISSQELFSYRLSKLAEQSAAYSSSLFNSELLFASLQSAAFQGRL